MKVLDSKKATEIRAEFVDKFIVKGDYYKKNIAKTKQAKCGQVYNGFLYNSFDFSKKMSIDKALLEIKKFDSGAYVMWDLHEIESLGVISDSKYSYDSVISIQPKEFYDLMYDLPDDFYIVKSDFSECVAFTSKEEHMVRVCFVAYEIEED